MPIPLQRHVQADKYSSPFSLVTRWRTLIWGLTWTLLCRWTPKPLNRWRLLWLKAFGATLYGCPFVHQRARITHPWRLTLHDRACLGDGTVAYTLGPVILENDCTVAQEAYLCTGTHDLSHPDTPLLTGTITVGAHAFIGLRAIVLPGVSIGANAIVGAGAVVTRDVPQQCAVAGNPAKPIRRK